MQLAILDYEVAVSLETVFLGPQLDYQYHIQLVPNNQLPEMHQVSSSKINELQNKQTIDK